MFKTNIPGYVYAAVIARNMGGGNFLLFELREILDLTQRLTRVILGTELDDGAAVPGIDIAGSLFSSRKKIGLKIGIGNGEIHS